MNAIISTTMFESAQAIGSNPYSVHLILKSKHATHYPYLDSKTNCLSSNKHLGSMMAVVRNH